MPPITFGLGLRTNGDPSQLRDGELTLAQGMEYRVGEPGVHKLPGRSTATTTGIGAAVRSLNYLQYDVASDVLAAVAGSTIYEAPPATNGMTFTATSVTSLDTTGIPTWAGFQDTWVMCDGVSTNYLRESGNVPGTSSPWRTNGMQPPDGQTTVTTSTAASSALRPNANTGSYTNPANAYDTGTNALATYALGSSTGAAVQHVWTFAADTTSGRTLYIRHAKAGTAFNPLSGTTKREDTFDEDDVSGTHTIEYCTDYTTAQTWIVLATSAASTTTSTVAINNAVNLSTFAVRATSDKTSTAAGTFKGQVFDIVIKTGTTTPVDIAHGLQYMVTERYVDSNGVSHESLPTGVSDTTGALSGLTSISVALPTQKNSFSLEFVIYRSIDEEDGGYPDMWEVGTAPITATTWLDSFGLSTTLTDDKDHLFEVLVALYPDGTSITAGINSPPPLSKLAIPFNGAMCYLPASANLAHRLYYSLSSAFSSAAIEQVPSIYFLDFVTPRNDTLVSAAVTNGGRTLLTFFASYTMLVNQLPQAGDPGTFDNRIREYVSNVRGAGGVRCVTEFTLPTGQTLVAAVDALGLWATNGVSALQDWSRDIKWGVDMAGVDLTTAQLVDNPAKRRLELLYINSSGGRSERHFFYGRLKQDGDGNTAPLHTGPNLTGYQCKHYAQLTGVWTGWSGDASTTGNVFYEEGADGDASNGYDSDGTVPYDVANGDLYPAGLGKAALVENGYPKFAGATKSITLIGTFRRDGSSTPITITKSYNTAHKKVWWHRYCDRHTIRIKDYTATALPALIAYEVDERGAGTGRDK